MSAHVVIAARGGPDAKSRFGGRLTEAQREALVEAMLSDMLEALGRCPAVDRIHLTTPTPALARLAAARRAELIVEAPGGLNAAFEAARRAVAAADPDGVVMLLPGDLPRLDGGDVAAVIEAAWEAVVLVPATADGGTGAVAAPARVALPLAFGPGSFQKHLSAARALGVQTRVIEAASLGFDMDRPEDIEALLGSGDGRRAAALLRRFSAGEAA